MDAMLARPLKLEILKCKYDKRLKVKTFGQQRILVDILDHVPFENTVIGYWLDKDRAPQYANETLNILIHGYRGVNSQVDNPTISYENFL